MIETAIPIETTVAIGIVGHRAVTWTMMMTVMAAGAAAHGS
jgi:hypothetical protein